MKQKKPKKQMFTIKPQNYIMICQKSNLMNTMNSQVLKKWSTNMILLIYFLKHIIMITGLKIKNQLIQQDKVIKKNLQIYLTCHH